MKLRFRSATAIAAALALTLSGLANATTVSPVVIDLQTSGRGVVSNISVTNTSAGPMTMEISVIPLKPT